MMKKLLASAALVASVSLGAVGPALAYAGPAGAAQPGQSCQSQPSSPGQASSAPGSAFNEPTPTSAGGIAGMHYAGNQPQNSVNPKSVSQYDVACFQVSN
jgi:hypothetical protein